MWKSFLQNTIFSLISASSPHVQFVRIHTSSLINIDKILNRLITKFYNDDDVNMIAAELRLTKMRSIPFYKKQSFIRNSDNRC